MRTVVAGTTEVMELLTDAKMALISGMPEDALTEPPKVTGTQHPLAVRLAVKKDFIQGKGSLTKLSAIYRIPYETLRGWSRDQKWTSEREKWMDAEEARLLATHQTPPANGMTPEAPLKNGDLTSVEAERIEMADKIKTQIEACDDLLSKSTTGDVFAKLAAAKDKLMGQWFDLRGVHRPGAQRPVKKNPRDQYPVFEGPAEPSLVEPEPAGVPQERVE